MRPEAHHRPTPPGATLIELLVTLCVIGIVLGLALPPLTRGFDRIQVRGAAQEVMTAFAVARAAAIAHGRPAAVLLDDASARISVVASGETVLSVPLAARHGVLLASSRDSMAYSAAGLGVGATNLRAIVRRGNAAETVLVSREGRTKVGQRRLR